MNVDVILVWVLVVAFFASLTRSTFGFGEALVAVPLLSLALPIESASAVVAITSVVNSLIILGTSREITNWRSGGWLIVASLSGIPFGVHFLTQVPEGLVKRSLAVVLALFALFQLRRGSSWRLRSDYWAIPFGFVGGVLGGAYNTAGPPMVIYGHLRGWSPGEFRATLQGVFLFNSLFVLGSHYFSGLWSDSVVRYVQFSLPLVIAAVPLGQWLNRRIHPQHFQRWLLGLLFLLSVLLFWSTL